MKESAAFVAKGIRMPGPGMSLMLKAMKITTILLTVFCLQVSAGSIAQVSISGKELSLSKIFDEIQEQSGYNLFYDAEHLKGTRKVTVDFRNAPVKDVLDFALRDQPLEYKITGKNIFISRKTPEKGNNNIENNLTQDKDPIRVVGKVINQNGDPVQGATVTVKGTKTATSTLGDGAFSIKLTDPNGTLTVTGANIDPLDYKLKAGQSLVVVQVTMSIGKLDEVQVVAYGTNTQRYQVGSVSKVTKEEIERQPLSNPLMALSGRVAGLEVSESSGAPGSSKRIRIRGQNTISQKPPGVGTLADRPDEPLYIIDGVPYAAQNGNINQLSSIASPGPDAKWGNPYAGMSPFSLLSSPDLESIEILKDADATSIYGSRGSNGVIIITTKRAKAGKSQLAINFYTGINTAANSVEMMSTKDYLSMRREAIYNDKAEGRINNPSFASTFADIKDYDSNRNVNWQDYFLGGQANTYDGSISYSGGSANTQFSLGTSLHKESYIYPGDLKYSRGTFNGNINHSNTDRTFLISLTANYAYDKNNSIGTPNALTAFTLPPNHPELIKDDGELLWSYKGVKLNTNPLSFLKQTYTIENYNLNSRLYLSYEPIQGLTAKVSVGYNTTNSAEHARIPKASQNPANNPQSSARFGANNFISWIIEPQVEYRTNVGDGRITVLAGSTFQKTENTSSLSTGNGYSNDILLGSLTAANTKTTTDAYSLYKYAALFGRINYTLKDKYILNVTGRRDGSSRFGPGRQFGNFGSMGLGWIFSQESWIKNKIKFLSFGKIRMSYGSTGNDNIGNYQFTANWTPLEFSYQGNGSGYRPVNLFKPDFSWTVTKKAEAAVELGLFKDKILATIAYYRNRSGNQLISYLIPIQTGFSQVTQNFDALIQNSGVEVSINSTNVASKNFTWSSSFNVSIPRNKLVSFDNLETSSYANSYKIGKPLSLVQGYQYKGVNDSSGLFQFYSKKGDLTYTPTFSEDFVEIGNLDPKFFGGIGNTLQYKGITLDFFFQFSQQMGPSSIQQIYANGIVGTFVNLPTLMNERWRKPGDISAHQRLYMLASGLPNQVRNSFVISTGAYETISYLRLKNVSLSYTLSPKILSKIKVRTCKFYINAQNLATITGYDGGDPENMSFYSIPPLRTIVFGTQISL